MPSLTPASSVFNRREFLQSLGGSVAMAAVAGCSHPPQTQIVPYRRAPIGQVDGLPRFFATTLKRSGYAHGVLVENHMGRPTKVEGNPGHPASLGATDIFAQASVLQLWDADRSQTVLQSGDTASWEVFENAWLSRARQFDSTGGAGLRILTGTITSPTLAAQLAGLLRKYPQARWCVHEPVNTDNVRAGTELAFAMRLSPRLRLDRAKRVLALDADFLCDPAAGVRYAHDFAMARSPELQAGSPVRLYAVESTPTLTGAMADHRLALESRRVAGIARALAKQLGVNAPSENTLEPGLARWVKAVAADLQGHRGESLIVVGAAQPPQLHALGFALNVALGNLNRTVDFSELVESRPPDDYALADLAAEMHGGGLDTLLVLDANPAYDAPVDLMFVEALRRVPHVVHAGLYVDETAEHAQWHLPLAHAFEAWSDARAFDGTVSLAQPLIAPLYQGRSTHELLALLAGDDVLDGRALVRRQWQAALPDEASWTAALEGGLIADSSLPAHTVELHDNGLSIQTQPGPGEGSLEIVLAPDPTIGDGQWANSGWLQELPKPLTQLTWGNAALVSPALAASEALSNGDVVELTLAGRTVRAPVWVMPGQAHRTVTLHLGYGRRRAGHNADARGVDAYALRNLHALWGASGLAIRKTTERFELASTQHHFKMEGRDPVRTATFAGYERDPQQIRAGDVYPQKPPSLYPPVQPGEYAWGMSIDLNACIGCKACTIACQAENNIPVVGADQVRRGREMHWIRVDRYYEGPPENPRTYSQPVPCMMCEHAPCELVCPVDATVHDSEGLNLQVYNRCVGTRFCSNNCPYKVRRFNFLKYVDTDADTLKAQRNPEVTVRQRGVMEKCTYCIQRIATAHIEADKADRRIRDGEVITACQAVCPTQAIRFGDTQDPGSQVSEAKALARHYVLLEELNTRPRTGYLARLRNLNPELQDT